MRFWWDNWLGSVGALYDRVLADRTPAIPDAVVADMVDEYGQWCWHRFDQLLPLEIILRIAGVKPPLGLSYDRIGWLLGSNQEFSVRSAFDVRQGVPYSPVELVWKVIAGFKGLPRVQTFLWLIFHDRVLTNVERGRRRLTQDCSCTICGVIEGDLDHILRRRPLTLSL
ncbi:hypothetical protein V6N12_069106 [Hibiscus sabdariffa]|uniref:Reverse transcriptase zinc-binding domain-containing protein n=1 Tax=Hibiscus sabdariffa TaxID=183260 RepID=A0ABR2FCV2_9ROSI